MLAKGIIHLPYALTFVDALACDPHVSQVKRFWRVMETLEQSDRQKFIRFVWGRSRLPREADWGER